MCEEKKVYLCVYGDYPGEMAVGKGKSLKDAYDEVNQEDDVVVEDCRFFEAIEVEVEIKIVKKEVVGKITAKK